jgi:hypothetical protein
MALQITIHVDGIPDRVLTASSAKLQEIAPVYGVDEDAYDTTNDALTALQSNLADYIKRRYLQDKNRKRPAETVGDDFE